ncbi:hypothetical protein RhiirA5_383365 [Rhizophagus irregularis]|uniref:Uncharacterized protein n=1 Tax=Rhizophagus irregularis TaxID=588596 RepID=A0A2N0NXB2_9GLOM|nr:hypothetical protein RhiirA5_383365 [Rhizophagus irregularis]
MSNIGDSVENISVDDFLEFVSAEGDMFLSYTTFQLGQFVENGFLKKLFNKNPQQPVDKAQLLIDTFGESANLNNFTQQVAVTNIQPTTLSLLFSIALYASSRSWNNFATRAYTKFGDMGDSEMATFFKQLPINDYCSLKNFCIKVFNERYKEFNEDIYHKVPNISTLNISTQIFILLEIRSVVKDYICSSHSGTKYPIVRLLDL